jgi:hypothetical protein
VALFKRRPVEVPASAGATAAFGVGMQVVVRLDRARYPDSMVEDPIGVITAPGDLVGSALYAPVVGKEMVWVVTFEEPFFGLDGTGPHESARVPQRSLEAAPEA